MMEELIKNAGHIPILIGMVLLYAILLNWALFRPISRMLDGRRERSLEAASLAESSRADLERRFEEYEQAVMDARRRGARVKEDARTEVATRRDAMLEKVRQDLREEASRSDALLAKDVAAARRDIEEAVPGLAHIAAQKILRRGGAR
jgi:F0F1-type ATP synthase membrane subunit b/b'